jgi:Protein of unknown function/Domain of unknown function (DUF1835)
MKTLHVAPGDSAAGSLKRAIQNAGQCEPVLTGGHDDLSCGPIDPDDASIRAAWWAPLYNVEGQDFELGLNTFWERVLNADERLVVWFGRHSAMELSFFLHFANRLYDRDFDIVDVTGLELPFTTRDGSRDITPPVAAVSIVRSEGLKSLLGKERPITDLEKNEARRQWRQLKSENAPFRVVTKDGLASAPVDYFDRVLLEQAAPEWRKIARIVGGALGETWEPYMQVGDLMLLTRVVALVKKQRLLADGDPWDMRNCRVRLP